MVYICGLDWPATVPLLVHGGLRMSLRSSDTVSSTQHTDLKYVRLGLNGLSGLLHLVVEDVVGSVESGHCRALIN